MYDVAAAHAPALTAALYTLVFLFLALRGLRVLASRGSSWAIEWVTAFDSASLLTRVAATLMLLSSAIHLALVPGHRGISGALFVVDALGFTVLAISAFIGTWWRPVAIAWLSATIAAYLLWVIAGWEPVDQVGIACKLLELIALGAVLRLGARKPARPLRRLIRASAYPMTVCATAVGVLLGGLAHPDTLHAHAGALLQPVAVITTPAQQQAASRLLAQTRTAIAPYQDSAAALAAGFQPGPGSDADPLLHWANKANAGAVLDPAHPQDLVYIRTHHGLKLIGAMFQMPKIGQWGPDPGGLLTQWHQHEGICFSPFGFEFSFATPFWTCPIGSTSITTPPMLHVWIVDNGKNGPFSADLDPVVQHQLQRE